MRASFWTLYLFYNCYLFCERIGGGEDWKKRIFAQLLAWIFVTMTVFTPSPTVFIPYHILYRCISCLFYDFTNSLSFRSTTPFSQNFSAVRAEPTPYNFHTLNEIKDLCNMQTDGRTDRRTEIACTLIIIIRGGYNTILCIGSAHSFVLFFKFYFQPLVFTVV